MKIWQKAVCLLILINSWLCLSGVGPYAVDLALSIGTVADPYCNSTGSDSAQDKAGSVCYADAYSKSMDSDSEGNICLAGWFEGNNLKINNITLYRSNPDYNCAEIFVAKLNPSGECLWAISFGGDRAVYVDKLVIDSRDNIYLAGDYYSSELSFGKNKLQNHSKLLLNDDDTADFYLACLDKSGKPIWALGGGGVNSDFVTDIILDSEQNVLLAANYRSYGCGFGGFSVSNSDMDETNLEAREDFLLSKISSAGSVQWIRQYGTPGVETVRSMHLDNNGDICLAGSYEGAKVTIDSLTAVSEIQDTHVWLAKLNPVGDAIWLKSIGRSGNTICEDLAVDQDGNIYLSGSFDDDYIDFQPLICMKQSRYGFSVNSFIAKYSPAGEVLWANTWGGDIADYTDEICLLDSLYIAVSYSSQSFCYSIDGKQYQNKMADLSADGGIFILDAAGNLFQNISCSGQGNQISTSLYADRNHGLWYSGVFDDIKCDIDSVTIPNQDLGGQDIFLIRLREGNYQHKED